jgi:hypothetical protein
VILSQQSISSHLIATGVSSQRLLFNFSSLTTTHRLLPIFFRCRPRCRAAEPPLRSHGKRLLSLFSPCPCGTFSSTTTGGTPTPLGRLPSLIERQGLFSCYNYFRINTSKSVSKQTTLTPFRMNTYEKHRGVGVLLLTRNSRKNFYPERASRPRDLSSFPTREFVLSESAGTDGSKNRPKKWYAPVVVGQRTEIPDSLPLAGTRQYSKGPIQPSFTSRKAPSRGARTKRPLSGAITKRRTCSCLISSRKPAMISP